jgi:hypothetical protein
VVDAFRTRQGFLHGGVIIPKKAGSKKRSESEGEPDPTVEVIGPDLVKELGESVEIIGDELKAKKKKKKKDKNKKLKLTPYREIELSDGGGFYIKTTCNLTDDGRVQVIQFRETPDPEGVKFTCTEPTYFENKGEFFEWISHLIIHNFDEIPYIKIVPLKDDEIKKKERETTDTMYL